MNPSAPSPAESATRPGNTFKESQDAKARVLEVPKGSSIRTLDELLAAAQVDLTKWRVERHVINSWETYSTRIKDGKNADAVRLPNFQVKAWLVPVTHLTNLTVDEIAARLRPLVEQKRAARQPGRPNKGGLGKCLLEIDAFDAHLGKLTDPWELGVEYNLPKAIADFKAGIEALLKRAQSYQIERVVLPLGNDFFNSDSLVGSTTAGTPQHESHKWQRTFADGCALVIDVVDTLRTRLGCPVDIVMVPGNHDFQRNYYLGEVLKATYKGVKGVKIMNDPNPRKYYQYHDCALMFTHGNEEKEAELPQLFAAEQPQLWAATRFREGRLGHVHRKKEVQFRSTQEYKGFTITYCRALSATDTWHHLKGYVGSHRALEGNLFAKGHGKVAHFPNVISSN